MIIIWMIKICDTSICISLKLIFQSLFGKWEVSHWMEKSECGSNLQERWQANNKKKFIENNLIFKNQSGFRASDSCINQLLSITHEIYQSFDDNLDIRAVFLDISKAFDKVWHKSLIFKLKQNSISDKILNIITDFRSFWKQRVLLNGQVSPWISIEAGVPQGSILEPLLFLIYINDLSDGLSTTAELFPDGMFLFL